MARPKPTAADFKQRKERAKKWKQFRRDHLLTQSRLAEIVGISRRTVQQIEAGKITPHPTTLRLFAMYEKKMRREFAVV